MIRIGLTNKEKNNFAFIKHMGGRKKNIFRMDGRGGKKNGKEQKKKIPIKYYKYNKYNIHYM